MRSILILIVTVFVLSFSPSVFAKSEKRVEKSSESRGKSVKIEAEDDVLILTEDEEEPTEIDEYELDDEETEDDTTVTAEKNSAVVIRNKLSAQTKFPLRVNVETNELTVITPKGEKIVTVLPDKAILNMLAANVLDELGGKGGLLYRQENPTATGSAEPSPTASNSAETGEEDSETELVLTEDGELAYEIVGFKNEKLLGLFLVKLQRKVYISAETGELIKINQGIFTRILDALSTPV